jgi:hypothetical protein
MIIMATITLSRLSHQDILVYIEGKSVIENIATRDLSDLEKKVYKAAAILRSHPFVEIEGTDEVLVATTYNSFEYDNYLMLNKITNEKSIVWITTRIKAKDLFEGKSNITARSHIIKTTSSTYQVSDSKGNIPVYKTVPIKDFTVDDLLTDKISSCMCLLM